MVVFFFFYSNSSIEVLLFPLPTLLSITKFHGLCTLTVPQRSSPLSHHARPLPLPSVLQQSTTAPPSSPPNPWVPFKNTDLIALQNSLPSLCS